MVDLRLIVCLLSVVINSGAEGILGRGRHFNTTDDVLTASTETTSKVLGSGANTQSGIYTSEYVFGNLKVETQDGGIPSPATGVYLLSQTVPQEGQITSLRTCGFVLDSDRETAPHDASEITIFSFVIVYRRMGDGYQQIYDPHPLNFAINATDSFGCGENDISSLGWIVSRGDRIGVLIQRIQCFPFLTGSEIDLTCPMHINLVDPVENCSQVHYFANTASVSGPSLPLTLDIYDGDAEDIFMNLDMTVETTDINPSYESDISMLTCAMNYPEGESNSLVIALPIIAGILLVLLIIMLAIGVTHYHRKKRSSRLSIQNKLEAHELAARRTNPSFTSPYQGAEQNQNHLYPSESQRASYISGSYVIAYPPYDENDVGEEAEYCDPATCEDDLKTQLENLQLRNVFIENIGLREYLGSGHFGVVYRGLLQYSGNSQISEVAVKTMQNDASYEEKVKFLQKAVIMGQFRSPYIVRLFGVITSTSPYMIISELMSKGDLRRYLHTTRISGIPDSNKMGELLLGHSKQIVSAMVYLSTRGYIHRDLAARNILVSKDGVCKISDFGLSRDLQDEDYYVSQSGPVPLRWTAPEALLHSKFSTSSDVWSFGVVLYEIWSFASQPYRMLNNKQVLHRILNGYRLPSPPGCPRAIYEIMIACWHPESSSRPTFSELHASLHISDSLLLEWSDKDKATYSEQARTIGAKFQEGETLHKDLHKRYEVHY